MKGLRPVTVNLVLEVLVMIGPWKYNCKSGVWSKGRMGPSTHHFRLLEADIILILDSLLADCDKVAKDLSRRVAGGSWSSPGEVNRARREAGHHRTGRGQGGG